MLFAAPHELHVAHITAPDVCDGTSAVGESRHPHSKAHPLVNRLNLALLSQLSPQSVPQRRDAGFALPSVLQETPARQVCTSPELLEFLQRLDDPLLQREKEDPDGVGIDGCRAAAGDVQRRPPVLPGRARWPMSLRCCMPSNRTAPTAS